MASSGKGVSGWLAASAVFVAGFGALWLVAKAVRAPAPPVLEALGEKAAPGLMVARRDRLPAGAETRERLWLFDPSPLFLPAGRETTEGVETGAVEGAGEVLKDFPDALQFPMLGPTRGILRPAAVGRPAEAAGRLAAPRWFDTLARTQDGPAASGKAAVRAARVEVSRADGSGLVAAFDVAGGDGWPADGWMPLVLTVFVGKEGAVGGPVIVSGSGDIENDERIRSIVARELLPTLRLRPGIYRLEVGP